MQGEIVDFWRGVEMLSPRAVPAVRTSDDVFEATAGAPLPWDADHPLRREKLGDFQTWRYVVYAGLFPLEEMFAVLDSVFSPKVKRYEERKLGFGALLAFAVTADGTMVRDSIVLSAAAWATARARQPGPNSPTWLDGFTALSEEVAQFLEERYLGTEDEPDEGRLDLDSLEDCLDIAADALEVARVLSVEGIRIRAEKVGRQSADSVEHDFLNSFIADDLARVSAAIAEDEEGKKVGAALREYLRPGKTLDLGARIDVRTRLDAVRRATDPDRIPRGRWPAAPDQPLALGQQLAVNEAVAMPAAGEHLLAVNGPPGTGKTTMLRDLIAALITERAAKLAELDDPLQAFVSSSHSWRSSHSRVVHRLRPDLTGFELVVASSNNGAVENVTLEIPSRGAIDERWRERAEEVDYFPLLAARAMPSGKRGPLGADSSAAWGLTAARLGNRGNRNEFVGAVWWTPKRKKGDDGPPFPPGLRDQLVGWEKRSEGLSWTDAVGAFEKARKREASIRRERLRTRKELDRLPGLESELATASTTERAAHDRVESLAPRRRELESELPVRKEERRRRIEARKEGARRRPCFLRFKARAAWRERDSRLATEIEALGERLDEIGEGLREIQGQERLHEEAATVLAAAEAAVGECLQVLSHYREQPGALLPDDEWLEDRELRECQAPWTDEEWNCARTELFLAGLALHKAFMIHAAEPMRESLDGAMEVVSGKAPRGLSAEETLAAWRILFLLVPVVSTTFASVPRLFGPLGAEALGWLLVDEAGQTTPQNAVGALWRSRRAVIVGDPLQLEPIVTILPAVEDAIREHYAVEAEWLTRDSSVQGLADRLNRFGTTVAGSVWVGAPLTVHRRCDQPMFELSNQIAYGGLMIDATDPALADDFTARYPTLPPSAWIDVDSQHSQGHWVPEEGAEVDRILADLKRLGFDFRQVLAIGPFRDVARRLGERTREKGTANGLRAGTIHTAQGKEADIVILVLGSRPGRAGEGARNWAARRPNLLNVAVSRARRRLYVIGSRDSWERQRYFDVLADQLPRGT